jgi:GlpG protein
LSEMIVTRDWTLLEKLPKGTLFGKIRQGEFWRLITPVLLHGGWLHILFNMAWLFILGRQVEERLGKFRYLFLSLLIGVMSNVAQYLVSGPIFVGYSGIIVGLVGFIWMRQKRAPWEGYPLQRPVIIFVTVFVLAMLGLEVISMTLEFFHMKPGFANIANTAHVIGGIFGTLLGRLSLFERSPQ